MTTDAAFILREAIPNLPVVRSDFLEYLLRHNLLNAAEAIGLDVAAGAVTADREVLLRYIDRVADNGRWNAALAAWNALCQRKILPYEPLDRQLGPWLTNATFATQPLNAGFDWHIPETGGVSASWRRSPDGLRIEFSGEQPEDCEVLNQSVPIQALRSYILHATCLLSGIAPGTGLNLRLTDTARGTEIAAAGLDGGTTQRSFKVPQGVSTARLSLSYRRRPGTTRIAGSITLTGVRLEIQP